MPGPTVTLDADKVELDFFALMFSLDLCVWIAAETNPYAEQLQWQKGRRDMEWKPTTSDEICAYLGIRIYMSVIDLPDIKMYWSGDLFFGGFTIANIMTRDRFEKLLSCGWSYWLWQNGPESRQMPSCQTHVDFCIRCLLGKLCST